MRGVSAAVVVPAGTQPPSSCNHPGPALPHPEPTAALSYVELAVTLAASDMPDTKRPELEIGQLTEWVRQGLGRPGLAEVRRIAERTCALGDLYSHGKLDAAGRGAGFRRV